MFISWICVRKKTESKSQKDQIRALVTNLIIGVYFQSF